MIADICAEYVLIGHSERRTMFGDNEVAVAKKDASCIQKWFETDVMRR